MNFRIQHCILSTLLFLGVSTGAFAQTILDDLNRAKEQRDKDTVSALEPINRRYNQTLENLLRDATQAGDFEMAIRIKQELGNSAGPNSVAPTAATFTYVHQGSAAPERVGFKNGSLPTMETADPIDVFKGKPIYFNSRSGQNIIYSVESTTPLTKLIYRGVAFFNFHIEIRDTSGQLVAASPPSNGKNTEQSITVMLPGLTTFNVVIHSEATNWTLIEGIQLFE